MPLRWVWYPSRKQTLPNPYCSDQGNSTTMPLMPDSHERGLTRYRRFRALRGFQSLATLHASTAEHVLCQ